METRRYSALRGLVTSGMVCLFVLTNATVTRAQEEERSSSAVADVVKGVVFDPTTWAPAVISYDATMRDWRTSQPFFRNGFVEHNPRFTVSGRPDDRAISYEAGHRLILRDSLATLGVSAAQNLASRIVERSLLQRYPEHRKVVKTIGWVQRIAIGSVMTYRLSAMHYRQAIHNAERAQKLGLR
jgi:hypothetical protein